MSRLLRVFMFITDVGFISYWLVTALELIPLEYAFKNYDDAILVAWNWSFFPLDMLVSLTGLGSLYLYTRSRKSYRPLAIISLTLTLCAGLQAVVFWTLRSDFSFAWWLPNLYLLLYPLVFLPSLLRETRELTPSGSKVPKVSRHP